MRSIIGIFLSCLLSVSLGDSDIYWEPYSGIVPENAVKVDETTDEDGSVVPVYVGQVYSPPCGIGALLPAGIFNNSSYVSPTFGSKACKSDKRIKILCSRNNDIFTWVPSSEISTLKVAEDCVDVGAEQGKTFFDLYFGRGRSQNNHVYGKAVVSEGCMYFPNQEKEEKITNDFEILCYKDAVERRKLVQTVEVTGERPNTSVAEDLPNGSGASDIYWKPYSGVVPGDAIRVHETRDWNGVPVSVYVGQVQSPRCAEGSLVPVAIFNNTKYVYPTNQRRTCEADKNIKILCSERSDIVTFFPLSDTGILKVDEDCVHAGHDDIYPVLYFGKGEFNDYPVYGRVLFEESAMYFGDGNDDVEGYTNEFDIICYKDATERRRLHPYVKNAINSSIWSFHVTEESLNASAPPDVYWRPYSGTVPPDAAIVDKTPYEFGGTVPVYLGQAHTSSCAKGSVQPVRITNGEGQVESTYGHYTCRQSSEIKILCTNNSDTFIWVPVTEVDYLNMEEDCVDAGGQDGDTYYTLYFGRGEVDNKKVYGKGIISDDIWGGTVVKERCMYYSDGSEKKINDKFDILCYKYAVQKRILKPYVPWYSGYAVSATTPRRTIDFIT